MKPFFIVNAVLSGVLLSLFTLSRFLGADPAPDITGHHWLVLTISVGILWLHAAIQKLKP